MKNLINKSVIIILVLAIGVLMYILLRPLSRNDFSLPKVEEITDDSEIATKEIMVTDGVRHNIPLQDIISGGPAQRWHSFH